MGTSALLGSALGPAAPIVSSLIGNAVSGGGSDPLQSLLGAIGDPFKMLFGQSTSQLASPFRSIPAAFASPASGGTIDGLIQGLGDIGGRINSATSNMLSDDPQTALKGQLDFQKENLLLQRVSQIIADHFKVLKAISDNSRIA
jgi:hypothetical protein